MQVNIFPALKDGEQSPFPSPNQEEAHMSESPDTVFITKHATTTGIEEREAKLVAGSPDRIRVKARYGYNYFWGNDWHRTREAAVARAEEMRKAKIASHEKSIAKLQKLTFA